MGAHKKKSRACVIKAPAPPCVVDRMALTAVRAETRRPVIWGLASIIVPRMTAVTIRPHPDILVLLPIRMTCLAVGRQMCADEGEGRPRMALGHVWHQPGLRSMAAYTICTQFAAVQIVVAAGTLVFGPFEFEGWMARAALHERMLPDQPEAGGAMVKLHRLGHFIPRLGGMAVLTGNGNLSVRRFLRNTVAVQSQGQDEESYHPMSSRPAFIGKPMPATGLCRRRSNGANH